MKKKHKVPVGNWPKCDAPIIYSNDGADKKHITVICVDDKYWVEHIKVKEKKRLELFTVLCYNKMDYESNAMRGGLVYEYSTYEIRGRGCKTWIAE